jgi:hypothetical protein
VAELTPCGVGDAMVEVGTLLFGPGKIFEVHIKHGPHMRVRGAAVKGA